MSESDPILEAIAALGDRISKLEEAVKNPPRKLGLTNAEIMADGAAVAQWWESPRAKVALEVLKLIAIGIVTYHAAKTGQQIPLPPAFTN